MPRQKPHSGKGLGKRRARESNPQPLSGHHISSVAASHSLTLRNSLRNLILRLALLPVKGLIALRAQRARKTGCSWIAAIGPECGRQRTGSHRFLALVPRCLDGFRWSRVSLLGVETDLPERQVDVEYIAQETCLVDAPAWHGRVRRVDPPYEYYELVRGPDGFARPWLRNVLVRIDPKDASVRVVGKIAPVGHPTFVGKDLYLSGPEQLRRIRNIVPAPGGAGSQQ